MIKRADHEGPNYVAWIYHDMLKYQQHIDEFLQSAAGAGIVKLSKAQHKQCQGIWAERWGKLHAPVHSVGLVLNPALMDVDWFDVDIQIQRDCRAVFGAWTDTPAEVTKCFVQLGAVGRKEGDLCSPEIWTAEAFRVGALSWWEVFGRGAPELRRIAIRVCSIVPVASASERNWSIFSYIHSKSRNRLYNNRVEQLVFVYSNLRLLRKLTIKGHVETCQFYEEEEEGEEEEE
jgi:hypothetical protein